MIWVTWRQHRMEGLAAVVILALIIPCILVTGFTLASAYQDMGMAACVAQHALCPGIRNAFVERFLGLILTFFLSVNALPVLAGMFVGAPLLARELEQGTHRLAWTQSITRLRWLAVKLSVLIGTTLLAFVTLIVLMTWWSGPWNAVRGPWEIYNLQGMVPVAFAIFALTLGIAVGMLIRRSVPAMAITLVICVLLQVAVAGLVRPHLLPPLSQTWHYDQPAPADEALGNLAVGSPILLDRQGQQLSNADLVQVCQPPLDRFNSEAQQAFARCEAEHGVHYLEFYQPASRFWLFQGMETGLFLLLAGLLLILTTWGIRKRIT